MNYMKSIRFPPPVADEMVRAILAGRKTVTRRVVKFMFPEDADSFQIERYAKDDSLSGLLVYENGKPSRVYEVPYRPGDILYVRERIAQPFLPESDEIHYYADYGDNNIVLRDGPYPDAIESKSVKWCPSASMPREAARIFLRVTDVRVERLQEMTDDDFVCDFGVCREAIQAVGRDALAIPFWDSTLKKPTDRALYGWASNPWVWVIEFERCENPEEKPLVGDAGNG